MVTREMLEERNAELHAELAEYERACAMVRGALLENQNVWAAMDEVEEEDGNGVSHNEVVPQPEGWVEAPEEWVPEDRLGEAPYEEDESWSEVVASVEDNCHLYDEYSHEPVNCDACNDAVEDEDGQS